MESSAPKPAADKQPAQRVRAAAEDVLRVHRHQRRVGRDRPRRAPRRLTSSARTGLNPCAYRTPSITARPPGGCRAADCPPAGQCIFRIATMTARNDSAFSAKHTASLVSASSTPAIAGSDDARRVDEHRVQRDRVREIAAIGDEMHVHRLPQRQVERGARTEPQRQHDQMPRLRSIRTRPGPRG